MKARHLPAQIPNVMVVLLAAIVYAAGMWGLIAFIVAVFPTTAHAGPKALGQLVIPAVDGGTSTNNTSAATPFPARVGGPVYLQAPTAAIWYAVDGRSSCTPAYPCFLLPAGASIDESIAVPLPDAGTTAGRIAMCCDTGVASCTLSVGALDGTERR